MVCTIILWKPGQDASWDSATYLDGARRLAAGEGYVTSRNALDEPTGLTPISLWPPGFSMAVALGILAGGDPLGAAAWVLTLSYVGAVAACFACAYYATRAAVPSALSAVFFGLMPATLDSLDAVLSDLPFTCAIGASSVLALRVAERERPSWPLQLASGIAIGSCFWFRYVGIGVAFAACVALLIARHERSPWARVRALSTTLSATAAVCAALFVRNVRIGHLSGGHAFHPSSIATNTAFALEGAVNALAPTWGLAHVGARFAMLAAVTATLAASIRLRSFRAPSVCVLGCMFVAYAGSLLLSASLTAFNSLDETRFWVPFWLLYAMFAASVLAKAEGPYRWCIALPTFAGMATCIVFYVVMLKIHLPSAQRPHELSERSWRRAASLVPDARECLVLSNDVRPLLVHRAIAANARLPDDHRSMNELRHAHPKLCIAFVKGWTPASSRVHKRAQEALLNAMSKGRQLRLIARDELVDVYRVAP